MTINRTLRVRVNTYRRFFRSRTLNSITRVFSPFIARITTRTVPLRVLFTRPINAFLFFLCPISITDIFFRTWLLLTSKLITNNCLFFRVYSRYVRNFRILIFFCFKLPTSILFRLFNNRVGNNQYDCFFLFGYLR